MTYITDGNYHLTSEWVWVICVLGGISLIGLICIVSEFLTTARLKLEAKMDLAQPLRLERFKREAYAEGVKDASRRESHCEE